LYLTSSFVFEDEDMRASFAEEKDRNIYSRYNPNTNEFVKKYVKWKATAGFAFASGMAAVYSTMAALLNSGDHIVSSSSVLGRHTPCSIIFQSGIFKHRILILTSQKRSKVSSHRIRRFFC
jgi:O-acetylhomoserine/O-acetylserine sulfhydrylase-like pyridoxal-dependent enzyme